MCMEIYIMWAGGSMRGVGVMFDIVEMLPQLGTEGPSTVNGEIFHMSSKNKLRCGERNILG